jgi:multidrug resistance protein, MATE family
MVAGVLIGVFNLTLVAVLRKQIPWLFTGDGDVANLVTQVTPIVAFMQLWDGISAVAQGVLRGVGRQEIGGWANLLTYYVLALPISFATAFGLGWKLVGLWAGVTLGLFM